MLKVLLAKVWSRVTSVLFKLVYQSLPHVKIRSQFSSLPLELFCRLEALASVSFLETQLNSMQYSIQVISSFYYFPKAPVMQARFLCPGLAWISDIPSSRFKLFSQ